MEVSSNKTVIESLDVLFAQYLVFVVITMGVSWVL